MDPAELDAALAENLRFGTLSEAESTLRHFHALYRRCLAGGDRLAAERCRRRIALGRRRAAMIARNPRVAETRRAEKEEIALWFSLWLDDPDRFFLWLELRQTSQGYRKRFPDSTG